MNFLALRRLRLEPSLAVRSFLPGTVFCAALFFSGPLFADPDPPWQGEAFSAEPAALLAAAEAVRASEDQDVQVIFREASYSFDEDGRLTHRFYQIYRISSPSGVEGWGRVERPWAPWHQHAPTIRARVVTADGAAYELDPKTLSESPVEEDSPEMYGDRRRLQAPLPAIAVGAVVEEEIVSRDREPYFAAGSTWQQPLGTWGATHLQRVVLEAPIELPLRHLVRADGIEVSETTAEGRRRIVFEGRDLPDWETLDFEVATPYDHPLVPYLAFSTGASWQRLAAEYSELVDARIAAGGADAAREQLPKTWDSASERISQALAELHRQVRYTGLELGAASLIPVSPEEVLKRKYGDCKDQATMLVAMLRADGIPANVALLNAGSGQDVEPELPGLGRFNHAIVYVPGSEPIWIDPTDPFARAGELPLGDQGRWALIVDAKTEELLRTPVARPEDNRLVEVREVFMSDLGVGRVVETSRYHGALERRQRHGSKGADRASQSESFTDYVERQYLADQLGDWDSTAPDDLAQPYQIRLEALAAGRVATDLEEAVVAILPSSLLADLPSTLLEPLDEARSADFVFHLPYVAEWHYRIHPPKGFEPRALPPDEVRQLGSATFEQRFVAEDGLVQADLRFATGQRRLSAEEFTALHDAVAGFLDQEALLIFFDHRAAKALAEGRAVEAIEDHRRLIAAEPAGAIHRMRLARALLSLGLGDAAITEARRALETEASSDAHWNLGFLLQHDAIGRRFGSGFDYEASLASLRRAVELDAENDTARLELAILLDHGPTGLQYGPGADLDEAIEVYRALREDFDTTDYDVNLLVDLFRTERFDELLELVRSSPEAGDVHRSLEIASLAMTRGTAEALRRARTLGRDQEQYLQLAASAVQNLLLIGRFQESAEIFKSLIPQAENPATLSSTVDLLTRIRPLDEIDLPPGEPLTVIKQAFIAMISETPDFDRVRELIHDPLGETDLDEMEPLEFRRQLLANSGGMRLDAVLAFFLAGLEANVTGDERTGYRVELRGAYGEEKLEFDAYLAEIDGRLLVVELGGYNGLALEVLRRLEAGDLKGGRQWLDWAREKRPKVEGDDPYLGDAFARLWTAGEKGDVERMRQAAAALLDDKGAEIARPILEQATASETESERLAALELALLEIHAQEEDHAALFALSERLIRKAPDSDRVFAAYATSGLRLGKLAEVERLAKARLEKDPSEMIAGKVLAEVNLRRGDYETGLEILQTTLALLPDDPRIHNEAAWVLLFSPEPDHDLALQLALRASEQSSYQHYGSLHTAAVAFAELGRVSEAYRVLLQAMNQDSRDQPQSSDWYVFARIAEHLGLVEHARLLYQRVEAPEGDDPLSTYELARRRLAGLSEPGPEASAGSPAAASMGEVR